MMAIARIHVKNDGDGKDPNDVLWDHILENYKSWSDFNVKLLYITQIVPDNYTSLIVDLNDINEFADFIAKYITGLPNIDGIYLFDLIKPKFFPVPKGTPFESKRFAAIIDSDPKDYASVYRKLSKIWTEDSSTITYVSFIFQSVGKDILVSFMSEDNDSAVKFVKEQIETIQGVRDVELLEITRTKLLVDGQEWMDYIKSYTDIELYSEEKDVDIEPWEYHDKFVCC